MASTSVDNAALTNNRKFPDSNKYINIGTLENFTPMAAAIAKPATRSCLFNMPQIAIEISNPLSADVFDVRTEPHESGDQQIAQTTNHLKNRNLLINLFAMFNEITAEIITQTIEKTKNKDPAVLNSKKPKGQINNNKNGG